MKFWGKLLGALFGWVLFRHPVGVAIGFAIGHAFDEGWLTGRLAPPVDAGEFVAPLYALAGSVAKANGRVSQAEIGATERLMRRMGLDDEQRRLAIESFNTGKREDFDVDSTAQAMRLWCQRRGDQRLIVLEVLAEIGAADGGLSQGAIERLARIATELRVPQVAFDWVVARYRGAAHARRESPRDAPPPTLERPDPYTVLGVARSASDGEIRRAYRRLMAQHHPDKLQSRGASPEMLRVAEERAREINAAYEQLRSLRGIT